MKGVLLAVVIAALVLEGRTIVIILTNAPLCFNMVRF